MKPRLCPVEDVRLVRHLQRQQRSIYRVSLQCGCHWWEERPMGYPPSLESGTCFAGHPIGPDRRAAAPKRIGSVSRPAPAPPQPVSLTASEMVAAVRAWQSNPGVRPLTCPNNLGHRPLVVEESGQTSVLRCQDCDYVQAVIPAVVLAAYVAGDRESE